MCDLSLCNPICLISTSSIFRIPSYSTNRNNAFNNELFPAPVRPTIPI